MIFLWLGVYEFFSRTDSTGTYTPLPDALGSTTALTDSTGTPQTKYTYDPFGNKHHRRETSNTVDFTGRGKRRRHRTVFTKNLVPGSIADPAAQPVVAETHRDPAALMPSGCVHSTCSC
jgi:hypothetical protein